MSASPCCACATANCSSRQAGAGAPEPFFFLPGGALRTDEDAARCARREWEEETGLPCGPLRPAAVVENFFGPPEKRQHEIGFYTTLKNRGVVGHSSNSTLENYR
ncbi:NUDIX domain-containing protein [Deinococcus sp. PESE-13]